MPSFLMMMGKALSGWLLLWEAGVAAEKLDGLDDGSKDAAFYKGKIASDSLLDAKNATDLDIATQGYGVGNWYFYNSQPEKAEEIFEKVIKGKYWAAFGYIAAEVDLGSRSKGQKN